MSDNKKESHDDEAWLDALRGRPFAHADQATQREAQDLRRALFTQHARSDDAASDNKAEFERLLFRLRREGLVDAPAGSTQRRWHVPLAIAAVIALAVALLRMLPSEGDQTDILRGTSPLQTLATDDVDATVQTIESILRRAGAEVSVHDLGAGTREVAATVPSDQIERLTRELAPFGLKSPQPDGTLHIKVQSQRR